MSETFEQKLERAAEVHATDTVSSGVSEWEMRAFRAGAAWAKAQGNPDQAGKLVELIQSGLQKDAALERLTADYNRLRDDKKRLSADLAELREQFDQMDEAAQDLLKERDELRAQCEALAGVLESVRSQMCWERDRDQLTMGMTDLHSSVTEVLAAYEKWEIK